MSLTRRRRMLRRTTTPGSRLPAVPPARPRRRKRRRKDPGKLLLELTGTCKIATYYFSDGFRLFSSWGTCVFDGHGYLHSFVQFSRPFYVL